MPTLHLSAVATELGRPIPLDQILDADVVANRALLTSEGASVVRTSDEPAWRLAATSARQTLALSPLAPDGVVYAHDGDREIDESAMRVLAALDLNSLPIFALGGNACGGLAPALRLAAALVTSGDLDTVLVATGASTDADRLLLAGGCVLGDGASSCLVSRHPDGGQLTYGGVVTITDASAAEARSDLARSKATMKGVRAAVTTLLQERSWAAGPSLRLVVPNYGTTTRRLLAAAAGIRDPDPTPERAAHLTHCHSADLLASIHGLLADGALDAGDRIVLVSTGTSTWSAIGLTRM